MGILMRWIGALCTLFLAGQAEVDASSASRNLSDPAQLDIAVIGGGAAGTVQILEFLRMKKKRGHNIGNLTIFEHGDEIGNNKTASGIIAAILGFASSHKFWDTSTPFAKLQNWLAMRLEQPSARALLFAEEVSFFQLGRDRRTQKDFQLKFFDDSRKHLEILLDEFPKLCAAVVGPFCCRPGSNAKKWMDAHGSKHSVWCDESHPAGIAHVFTAIAEEMCQKEAAQRDGFEIFLAERARQSFDKCRAVGTTNRTREADGVTMTRIEKIIESSLFAALWSDKEGFVRVEKFYPIAREIFKEHQVNVQTDCTVRYVQPRPFRRQGDSHKLAIKTDYSCRRGNGGNFDRVIVAAGANTVPLMRRHDRKISYQLMPVKGYAVAVPDPIFNEKDRQIGIEYEDLGHYIRSQADGGVRYGFGRQLGNFDDQLLNPTFEGWKPDTGPNATGLGRRLVKNKNHVGLAGFRPLSAFIRFPLLKRYTGTWGGLFVNSGYGFYGYGMTWKSAEIVANLTVADDGSPNVVQEYDSTWLDEHGPLICPRSIVSLLIFSVGFGIVSCLFYVVTSYGYSQPHSSIAAMEKMFESGLLEKDDKDIISRNVASTLGSATVLEQYEKAVAMRLNSIIMHDEFHKELRTIRSRARAATDDNGSDDKVEEDKKTLTDRKPLLPAADSDDKVKGTNETLKDLKPLYDILCAAESLMKWHVWSTFFALLTGVLNSYTGLFVLAAARGLRIVFVQSLSPNDAMIKKLQTWCEAMAELPYGMVSWRHASQPRQRAWNITRSVVDAIDNDIDGVNAGLILSYYLVYQFGDSWASYLHCAGDQSELAWATNQYQQLLQCTPVVGLIVSWAGPYLGIVVHTLFYLVVQAWATMHHLKTARAELDELQKLKCGRDLFNEMDEVVMKHWDEFWRHSCHAFDLSGLFEMQQASEALCNVTSDIIRTSSLRLRGKCSKSYHGRYGKLSKFALKVVLEAAGSLLLISSTSAVTYERLTAKQVASFLCSVVVSSFGIIENVIFQLQRHSDVEANMSWRWYGQLGFWLQRGLVVLVFLALLISWVRFSGIFYCSSHAFDPVMGCMDFEDPQQYELQYEQPCTPELYVYCFLSAGCIALAVALAWLKSQDIVPAGLLLMDSPKDGSD